MRFNMAELTDLFLNALSVDWPQDEDSIDKIVDAAMRISKHEIEEVKVRYLPGAPHIEQVGWGSWIDLYTYEDVTLKAGQREYISMGVAMQLPQGYEAILAPRSSTFKRYGLLQSNSIGVIDSTYNGDDDIWCMPVVATRDIYIPKGTRICQFRIQKEQPKIHFVTVSSLGNENRNGFGSSGV